MVFLLTLNLFEENGRRQHPGVTCQSIAAAFLDTQDYWKYPEIAHAIAFLNEMIYLSVLTSL